MLSRVWKQEYYIALALVVLTVVGNSPALAANEIQWEESIEKGLAEAEKTGKPIMMDFYTEW